MGNFCSDSKPTTQEEIKLRLIEEIRQENKSKGIPDSYIESQTIKYQFIQKHILVEYLFNQFPEIYPLPERKKVEKIIEDVIKARFIFPIPEESYPKKVADAFLKYKNKKFGKERTQLLEELGEKDPTSWQSIQDKIDKGSEQQAEDEINQHFMHRESIRAYWEEQEILKMKYMISQCPNNFTYVHKETSYQIPDSYIESQTIKYQIIHKHNLVDYLFNQFPEIYPLPERKKVEKIIEDFIYFHFDLPIPEESYPKEVADAFIKYKNKKIEKERTQLLEELRGKEPNSWQYFQDINAEGNEELAEDIINMLFMHRESLRAYWEQQEILKMKYMISQCPENFTYIHQETPAYQIPYYQLLETKSSMLPGYTWDSTYAENDHPEEDMGYVGSLFCGIFIAAAVIKAMKKFGTSIQFSGGKNKQA